jgi:DNA-binding PadR family transcriptional regulator
MTDVNPGVAQDRSGWLVLLLDRDALGAAGPEELDPVRVQKGMFLLSERGPARGIYTFRAYDWGPFSSAIYSDLDALVTQGYLDRQRVPGRTWCTYQVTPSGHELASGMAQQIGPTHVGWLRSAREFLTTRSFAQLLREIYEEYPDFAVNSRFSG